MFAGVCNVSTASCECHEGFVKGISGSCDTQEDVEEPRSMLPLIIAGIGLFAFILVISFVRLIEVSVSH